METKNQLNRSRSLSQLFLAVFLDLFGFGIIIPILPFLFVDLGLKYGAWFEDYKGLLYGGIIAVYSFMQFLMSPIWGRLSDKHGRRPIILIGVLGSSIGFAIFGLANDLIILFLARIVAGFFTAATLTTANAYIADVTPPAKRGGAYGLIMSAFGLGFALGPGIGGYMANLEIWGFSGHIIPSMLAALLSLINFVGAYFFVKESLTAEMKSNISKDRSLFSISDISKLKKYPGSLTFVGLFALVTFGFSNWIASFSINAPTIDPSIGEAELGIYFTFTGLVLFLSQPLIVKPFNNKYGEKPLIIAGAILGLIGFLTLPLATTFFEMFITNTPLILGIAFLNPSITAVISKTVPPNMQGEIMGINQGMAALTRVIGPLIAGGLLTVNIFYPYYVGAAFFLLILVLLIMKVRFPDEEDIIRITMSQDY